MKVRRPGSVLVLVVVIMLLSGCEEQQSAPAAQEYGPLTAPTGPRGTPEPAARLEKFLLRDVNMPPDWKLLIKLCETVAPDQPGAARTLGAIKLALDRQRSLRLRCATLELGEARLRQLFACASASSRDPHVRLRALTVLPAIGGAQSMKLCVAALNDGNEGVRHTAAYVLMEIAGPPILGELEETLDSIRLGPQEEAALTLALLRAGTRRDVSPRLEELWTESEADRASVLDAMAIVGKPAFVEYAWQGLRSKDGLVSGAAQRLFVSSARPDDIAQAIGNLDSLYSDTLAVMNVVELPLGPEARWWGDGPLTRSGLSEWWERHRGQWSREKVLSEWLRFNDGTPNGDFYRREATNMLTRSWDDKYGPILVKALRERRPVASYNAILFRLEVALALARNGKAEGIEYLIDVLGSAPGAEIWNMTVLELRRISGLTLSGRDPQWGEWFARNRDQFAPAEKPASP